MTEHSEPLEELYARAARAARAGSRTFELATRLVPLPLARAAHAIYWFCSYTRGLSRQAASPEQGHHDLDQWASMVANGLRGRLARHPVLEVFLDTAANHSLPEDAALGFIEGARMELDHAWFESFSQLREYGSRTGGGMGVLMTHAMGYRGPAPEYMAGLGLAVELASAVRTLGDQLERGRLLLPREELSSFGYREADLRAHVRNQAFRRLMQFQVERARDYFRRSEPGIALLDPRGRFAVKLVYDLNLRTLARIEASDFDVFRRSPQVPAAERCWITARSVAGPLTRHLWRRVSA
jgi:phytoene synthase